MKNSTLIILIIAFLVFFLLIIYWPKENLRNRNFSQNLEEVQIRKMKSPELEGLKNWINSGGIESIESLKGKVILVDFWTYSCINCIRTLPYLQSWQEKYADKGLVILGIHSPEFAFEHKLENLKKAVKKYGLTYPIAQDNDFKTWRNFKNRYWPAKYLIDQNGYIVYTHFGEGKYQETENKIRELLGLNKEILGKVMKNNKQKTPETYLGKSRRKKFLGNGFQGKLNEGQWTVFGPWEENSESVFAKKISDNKFSLKMKVKAAEANLVMEGDAEVEVWIDDEFYKKIKVKDSQLYNIFDFSKEKSDSDEYKVREIELKFLGEEVKLFAWTFG